MADVGEMYLVHTMLRREFGLLPDLIRGADRNDAKRRAFIGAHAKLVSRSCIRITKAKTWFSGRCFSNGPRPRRRRSWPSWRNNITPSRLRTTKRSIGSVTGAGSAAMGKDSQRCSMISYGS